MLILFFFFTDILNHLDLKFFTLLLLSVEYKIIMSYIWKNLSNALKIKNQINCWFLMSRKTQFLYFQKQKKSSDEKINLLENFSNKNYGNTQK